MNSVPTSTVDNTYELFPEGTFVGILGGAKIKTFDDGDAVLSVSTQKTAPATDADPDTNGRTFTGQIRLVHKGQALVDIERIDGSTSFPLRRAAGLLAGLGEAVGAAVRENGAVSCDFASLVDALVDGEFEDMGVTIRVGHNSWETKDGDTRTSDEYLQIAGA